MGKYNVGVAKERTFLMSICDTSVTVTIEDNDGVYVEIQHNDIMLIGTVKPLKCAIFTPQ